jgi:aminocarboxymuconate-semialdehyde decarboxylase
MIIDWHSHVYPPEIARDPHWKEAGYPMTIERNLEAHAAAGIDFMVVTNTIHRTRGKSPEEALAIIRRWDEYAAQIQGQHADRIVSLASTIPGGGPDFLRELERAIREYKLHGVLINSSADGHYPDEPECEPFWELVNDLKVPVMIHAPAASFGEELMWPCHLVSSIGRPVDEALCLARLIVLGLYERYPDVKVVVSHAGGGISEFIGRMNYAYELGEAGNFLTGEPYHPKLITQRPLEYLKKAYLDTVSYHEPAVMCAINTVGAKHVVFGSDAPPMLPLLPTARKLVEDLPISSEDREDIFWRNAADLLGLQLPVGRA